MDKFAPSPMRDVVMSFRMTAAERAWLDGHARRLGTTRTGALRYLLAQVDESMAEASANGRPSSGEAGG